MTSLLCTAVQGGYYAITTWLPTFLKTERNLSVLNTGGYLLVIILGSFCGYIVGAYLADRLGRRANLLIFSVLSAASVYLYTQVPLSNEQMLVLGFPLGFAASGIFSGIGAYLTELFPSSVRATGGLRLQLRARHRCAVPESGGLPEPDAWVGLGHRRLRHRGLCDGDPDRAAAARDQGRELS